MLHTILTKVRSRKTIHFLQIILIVSTSGFHKSVIILLAKLLSLSLLFLFAERHLGQRDSHTCYHSENFLILPSLAVVFANLFSIQTCEYLSLTYPWFNLFDWYPLFGFLSKPHNHFNTFLNIMSPWRLSGRLWVRLNQLTHCWQNVNPFSALPPRWCRICTSLACPQTMNMAYSYRVNKDIHREGEDPFALWIHCFHNNKLHPKFTAKASLRHNVHHWHIILFTYFVGSPRHGRETPLQSFHTHGRWGC